MTPARPSVPGMRLIILNEIGAALISVSFVLPFCYGKTLELGDLAFFMKKPEARRQCRLAGSRHGR
jgi:hypothetical protein